MELADILSILDRFDASSATGLELETEGVCLKLDKTAAVVPTGAPAAIPAAAPAAPAAVPAPRAETEAVYIKAPLVGAFYAASGPDKAPFAAPGDTVKKGQTVCILEAMKMMSEVAAPMDCVIEAVLLKDGDLAGFNAPIFRVRPL